MRAVVGGWPRFIVGLMYRGWLLADLAAPAHVRYMDVVWVAGMRPTQREEWHIVYMSGVFECLDDVMWIALAVWLHGPTVGGFPFQLH